MATIEQLSAKVWQGQSAGHTLYLRLGDCVVRFNTNEEKLLACMSSYFQPFLTGPADHADIEVAALEMPNSKLDLPFVDWPRDPGKTGRKDTYIDLGDGRVCRKARTGMQYLINGSEQMIFGECLSNDNQVVNFIISQYISWLVHRDWVLCHASAITNGSVGIGLSGFSGGGKSTLALHLMRAGLKFVSNDRLLIRNDGQGGPALMAGVPKQPRINPGTVLNNPDLTDVIEPARRAELSILRQDEIWDLEEKYDADIDRIFGAGRFVLSSSLNHYFVLNWSRHSSDPTEFKAVDIEERRDLLEAIVKSPGPFFVTENGLPPENPYHCAIEGYVDVLKGVNVVEITGKVDFHAAVAEISALTK